MNTKLFLYHFKNIFVSSAVVNPVNRSRTAVTVVNIILLITEAVHTIYIYMTLLLRLKAFEKSTKSRTNSTKWNKHKKIPTSYAKAVHCWKNNQTPRFHISINIIKVLIVFNDELLAAFANPEDLKTIMLKIILSFILLITNQNE